MQHTKRLFLPIILALSSIAAVAQPANDECAAAIPLPTVLNWCSSAGEFTNVGATPSTFGPATCFGPTTQNDVWFKFTAEATDVTITVRGRTAQAPGGTLEDPQVSLYLGNCGGTINQLECQSAPGNTNVVEAYQGGLYVGATYLIRVQGAAGQTGTFQLCIQNYNPPVEPTSDCPTASILCDKSPFVVQKVSGAGTNTKELDDAACFSNGAPVNNESNSTWFVWICAQSGTLEFTLTPLSAPDDLDFVIYRLPNGVGNCQNKEVVRCMASGDNVFPSPCMGPTGLRAGDPDISEDAGCANNGDDAWLAPLNMVQGETYALCVNNFSSSGNGFSIEFGGTGEFLGPEPKFTVDPLAICLDASVDITDASTFALGNITNVNWSFGIDATPLVASGKGPHTVSFAQPGVHPIVLTVETNLGCKVTEIQSVMVFPDVEVDTVISEPDCNGGSNGAINITNITSGTPPYLFSWNGGPFQSSNSLSGLPVGVYSLVIKDQNNCETDLNIDVQERKMTVRPEVTPPLCFGDENGLIVLVPTNGVGPYQFDFGNGYVPENQLDGVAAGVYTVQGIDGTLCKGTFTVTVTDHLPLELTMDTVGISCFGANDGTATANPTGGVGNYTYLWDNGQTTQTATGLMPGTHTVTVNDGNECAVIGSVFIFEPEDVGVQLVDVLDLLCNGVAEGEIRVQGIGGRQPYTFSADGKNFVPTDTLTGLLAGNYWVKIKDAGGCVDSVFATIAQPPALIVDAEPGDTLLELGFNLKIRTVTAPPARPVAFQWTPTLGLDCTTCAEPTVTAIQSQTYIVQVTDSTGCVAFDTVRVRVDDKRPIYIPNIFQPEKAGLNERFTLYGGPAAAEIALLRIFDRWGELVFETQDVPLNDPQLGWDGSFRGRRLDGVFAYYALVRFVDSSELPFEGNVTVLR